MFTLQGQSAAFHSFVWRLDLTLGKQSIMNPNSKRTIRGRVLSIAQGTQPDQSVIRLHMGAEITSLEIPTESLNTARAGDWLTIENGQPRVATPNLSPGRTLAWMERIQDPRRQHAMKIRAQVEAGIRSFFQGRTFLETRTPLLVPCPGMEPHIRPYQLTTGSYLPTSPEFAMKRLLVGGLERIFQICPAFRNEPTSPHHSPEFTMLEWYRAWAGYEEIMRDTEELFASLAREILGCTEGEEILNYQGRTIRVSTPWPRLRVRDLFEKHAAVDLVKSPRVEDLRVHCERLSLGWQTHDTWDDLYFRIWLNCIEPALPTDQAVFVIRYPASQAALAVVDQDPDGSRWARRFEAYAGGLELGNAFEELTDPNEQRKRFVEDMELRAEMYGPSFPKNPLDEEFLQALEEGMPPSGGIAVGVDRMVMLLANEPELDKTLWLKSYAGTEEKSE